MDNKEHTSIDAKIASNEELDLDVSIITDEVSNISKASVDLPSMPSIGIITKVNKTKKTARVKFANKKVIGEDFELKILQPTVIYSGKSGITSKMNIKRGDKVLIAYISGHFSNGIIVGKIPR